MPKISDQARNTRKEQVYRMVTNHPEGIKTSEIEQVLNIPDRTLRDYLRALEEEYRIWKEGWYWKPMPSDLQRPIKIEPTPEQAVILYIALRTFVKQSDRRNPLAEKLLMDLARLANNKLHLGEDLERAAAELAQETTDENYQDIFQVVVRAYLQRRRLRVIYHPYRSEPFETVVSPYLIEPSGFGYGTYIIGHSSTPNALRTYKLERIQAAELTSETFEVPADFRGLEILRNSWSIFTSDKTIHVVLRFKPEVARRVRESNWQGENIEFGEAGDDLLYAFDIADTTDLKPWIRTWGANCEVLEPQSLRNEMTGEARALAAMYGWQTTGGRDDRSSRFKDIFGT